MQNLGLEWTSDGDWKYNENGFIPQTNVNYIAQQIDILLRSKPGDNIYNPVYFFDIARFLSMPNTEQTAAKLKSELYSVISLIPEIQNYDVSIDVIPTAVDQINLLIDIIGTAGEGQSLKYNLAFNSSSSTLLGYTITNHTPYTTTATREVIERIWIENATSEIELAHLPVNSFGKVYENDYGVSPITGAYILHIETPADVSGNIPGYEFISELNPSGDLEISVVSGNAFLLCTLSGDYTGLEDIMFNTSPTYAVAYSGDPETSIIVESPDLDVTRGTIISTIPMTSFWLNLSYNESYAEFVGTREDTMELEKNSAVFNGRSSYRHYATLSRALPSGTYTVVYNTYEYR